jgi:UDP-N-acetylglucosamine--N-acetylmuramyl-(pentapeptide) pyrophosphoryl-undecaprenol N-acetylglucosamine transferase
MRIVFAGGGTGGHLYPGLAIARALVRLAPGVRPLFVGAERGVERDILPGSGFEHLLLDLHPLYRTRPWENWRTVAGLVSAWSALGRAFAAEKPALVVGTGGYASGAPLAYAARGRIPIALQEQNSQPGITTRLFARRARAIFLGTPEAAARLAVRDPGVFADTGNPIEPPPRPRPDIATARRAWGFPDRGGTVVLAFGGSQGARAINEAVDAWVARGLPPDTYLIWGTGRAPYEQFAARASARVVVRPYLAPIAEAYAAADLAVTRAGALTLAELCAWGIASVLVPLKTAAADHQTANARALEAAGGCLVITQDALNAERLDATVRALAGDRARLASLAAGALRRARPDAAEDIARRILTLLHLKQLET